MADRADRQNEDEELVETLRAMRINEASAYADPDNLAYPLDTQDQVFAAWNQLQDPAVEDRYNHDELELMKQRVRDAARQKGVGIDDDAHRRS